VTQRSGLLAKSKKGISTLKKVRKSTKSLRPKGLVRFGTIQKKEAKRDVV